MFRLCCSMLSSLSMRRSSLGKLSAGLGTSKCWKVALSSQVYLSIDRLKCKRGTSHSQDSSRVWVLVAQCSQSQRDIAFRGGGEEKVRLWTGGRI